MPHCVSSTSPKERVAVPLRNEESGACVFLYYYRRQPNVGESAPSAKQRKRRKPINIIYIKDRGGGRGGGGGGGSVGDLDFSSCIFTSVTVAGAGTRCRQRREGQSL